jgi:hypothetical protein
MDKTSLVINELKKFSDRIIVFTTENRPFVGCEVKTFDKSVGHNLVFEPRKWIIENIGSDWDYVLYNEDDILITESSFNSATKIQLSLEYPFVSGFNRFERKDGIKYWIDQHPDHGIHTGNSGKQYITKDSEWWIPANFHSGNFLVSKEYILRLINEGKFDSRHSQYNITYCGVLESGATSLYRHLTKILPINFESIECEHLDNKYLFIQPTPTTEDLKKILNG